MSCRALARRWGRGAQARLRRFGFFGGISQKNHAVIVIRGTASESGRQMAVRRGPATTGVRRSAPIPSPRNFPPIGVVPGGACGLLQPSRNRAFESYLIDARSKCCPVCQLGLDHCWPSMICRDGFPVSPGRAVIMFEATRDEQIVLLEAPAEAKAINRPQHRQDGYSFASTRGGANAAYPLIRAMRRQGGFARWRAPGDAQLSQICRSLRRGAGDSSVTV